MADPVTTVLASGQSLTQNTTVDFTAQTAGTLLELHVASDDYASGTPSGWSVGFVVDNGGQFFGHYVWWKKSTGSETSVTYGIGSATKSAYQVFAHTNIDGTDQFDVGAGQWASQSNSTYTTPASPTTSTGRKYAMAHMAYQESSAVLFSGVDTWINSYIEKGEYVTTGAPPTYALGSAGLAFDGGGTTQSGANGVIGDTIVSAGGIIVVYNVSSAGGATNVDAGVATGTGVANNPTVTSTDQSAGPTTDITVTGWTATGGTGTLSSAIDEYPYDDADYVTSPNNPTTSVFEVKFPGFNDPASSAGHIFSYRLRHRNTTTYTVVVGLYQGATLKASRTHTADLTTSFQTFDVTLSGAEADSITDYNDLRLRFTTTAA